LYFYSFVNDGKDITIIVNTSFPDEFDESCFFKYLEFKTNPIIKKEEKSAKVSVLHNNAKDIVAQAHHRVQIYFLTLLSRSIFRKFHYYLTIRTIEFLP
jgi:hypothetical protein